MYTFYCRCILFRLIPQKGSSCMDRRPKTHMPLTSKSHGEQEHGTEKSVIVHFFPALSTSIISNKNLTVLEYLIQAITRSANRTGVSNELKYPYYIIIYCIASLQAHFTRLQHAERFQATFYRYKRNHFHLQPLLWVLFAI